VGGVGVEAPAVADDEEEGVHGEVAEWQSGKVTEWQSEEGVRRRWF
jgi:hypothetical protein